MTFDSYIFILCFLPFTLICYFLLSKGNCGKRAHIFLIAASLLFIGYGSNWMTLGVFLLSAIINYIAHIILARDRPYNKFFLAAAVLFNIVLLGGFKYADSFIVRANNLLNTNFTLVNIILPIGISFYTFQEISILVDTYKHQVDKCDFVDYLLYMCYFPRFISGPIVLQNEFLPQLKDDRKLVFNWENFVKGFYRFALGLGKKIIIADTLAVEVAAVYSNITYYSNPLDYIVAIVSFSLELYFDFSGYSDMAIGVSNMFNFSLPENFNSPYKTKNIKEFWDRWHISLTNFLTKYVYFPLGGSRKGIVRTYVNIMIVFLVSGLWHGTNGFWPFAVWGLLHGGASVIYRTFRKAIDKLPAVFNRFITFIFVSIAWIPFRTRSIPETIEILKKLCNWTCWTPVSESALACFKFETLNAIGRLLEIEFLTTTNYFTIITFMTIAIFMAVGCKNTKEIIDDFKPTLLKSIVASVIIVFCMLSFSKVGTFIYAGF